jgi:hypothetical protein
MNSMVGYIISIGLYMGLYYGNVWNARRFPFLSPLMYSEKSTAKKYVQYNQTKILDSKFRVDNDMLKDYGLPRLTASHTLGMTAVNIAITAAITHMIIWHWHDIKSAFEIFAPLKKLFKPKEWDLKFWKYEEKKLTYDEAEEIDPHYRLMQAYDDVPSWWFGSIWIISACVGLLTSRLAGSTLEVWAFLIAILLSAVSLTFFAGLTAMFGFNLNVQPLIQMIGAYLLPGR